MFTTAMLESKACADSKPTASDCIACGALVCKGMLDYFEGMPNFSLMGRCCSC